MRTIWECGNGRHVLLPKPRFLSSTNGSLISTTPHTHAALAIDHQGLMYHQAPDMDGDFVRAWTLIHELSEQLAHNQKMISTLASQAGLLQVRPTYKPGGYF